MNNQYKDALKQGYNDLQNLIRLEDKKIEESRSKIAEYEKKMEEIQELLK